MATTSIWAVKDNLDRVLNYASNPLKTKETDSGYEYIGLENVIDYAVNDDKMKVLSRYIINLSLYCRNISFFSSGEISSEQVVDF